MKKQTFLPILFLLFFFMIAFNNVKASPGDSCSSAISLTPGGTVSDYAFHTPDTAMWFSFIADSANMVITLSNPVLPADTPVEYLHTLKLYAGTCSGLTLIGTSTIRFGSDTLPEVYKEGLTPGTKYYVSVSKYNTIGCRICNHYPSYFNIYVNGIFSTIMATATCVSSPCGPNLVCNGDFNNGSGTCYAIPISSCSAFSGMNYTSSPCHFTGTNNLDQYLIQSENYDPTFFMSPVGPQGQAYSFWGDSPHSGAAVVAWQQDIPVIIGAVYQWSVWYEDLDLPGIALGGGNNPGATLLMEVNGASPALWQGTIDNTYFNSWTKVCENWTANSSTADLQIIDDAEPPKGGDGYDFQINNISFAMIALPTMTITADPPRICTGNPTTLSVSPVVPGATYSWSTGQTGTSISVTSASTYNVTESLSGCGSQTASITITVNPNISVNVTYPSPICAGESATATVSGGTSPYTYRWSPGGVTTASIPIYTSGTYTLDVTDANGCIYQGDFSLTVIPTPPAPAVSGIMFACGGSSPYTYTYSVTNTSAGASYTWAVNGGTNNTVSSPGTPATAILRTIP